jgi:hypothetical protein
MKYVKTLQSLSLEKIQTTMKILENELKNEKEKNNQINIEHLNKIIIFQKRIELINKESYMVKQERGKLIESLEKRVDILDQQITIEKRQNEQKISIERIEHANSLATEKMLRQFLKEKIRKMEERAEKGGVEELKKIVFGL